jgi:pimeloyl-ACP methyl ester carboxylesterase
MPDFPYIFRFLLCLLGILFALPILALIVLAFTLPITISGIGYLLGCSLLVSGLILAPWGGKNSLPLAMTGIIALVLVAGTRIALAAQDRTSKLRVITLPQGKETSWINTLIDEQDSLVFGEAIFHRIGGDSPREHEGITAAFQIGYSEMRENHRWYASTFLNTYLNVQKPAGFDVVFVEPESLRRPKTAIVFLHGYMGNVTLQCWEIAQAVGEFGASTVCPSMDWTGQWWHPEGEAILRSTFRYFREQGIETFYLGGFSNGGFGISRLASKLKGENGLRGLIFINGISDGASIRETGLPVLILQGIQDQRVPAAGVRQVAKAIGDLGAYVELEGDHFMIIKQPELVQRAITIWLEEHGLYQ